MSDRNQSANPESALAAALARSVRAPETPEGVAWEMTRMILACAETPPSRADILDLYAECLTAAEGRRLARNFGVH